MLKYFLILITPLMVIGQYDKESILTPPVPKETLLFGNRISLQNSFLALYANDETHGDYAGSCYYYSFDGEWNLIKKIFSPEIQEGDYFGLPYFTKNTLFIGAVGADFKNQSVGIVYAYNYHDSIEFKYKLKTNVAFGSFGNRITSFDSLLCISANGEENDKGAVYIYSFNSDTAYILQRLAPSELEQSDFFGNPAISKNYVAIGVPEDNNQYGVSVGTVYLYQRDSLSGAWNDYQIIFSPNPGQDQFFGRPVHFYNSYLFIGEPGDIFAPAPGSLHVYKYNLDSLDWRYHQELVSGRGYRERFGYSIATYDSLLLVGAIEDSVNGIADVGSAYLFSLESDGYWKSKKKFIPSNGKRGDRFGWAVEMNKEFIAISSDLKSVNGYSNVGTVYIYSDYQTFISNHKIQPLVFELLQNYPNPFNSSTKIDFILQKPGKVEFKVFNILGEIVGVLENSRKQAGKHDIQFDASKLSSGIYFYQLKFEDQLQTKRMLFLK